MTIVPPATGPALPTLAPTLADAPMLPIWVVLPLVGATMLVVAWHVLSVNASGMPPSRRRIRTANGFLMLFLAALLGYAFGMATPERPRLFVIVWVLIAGLVTIVIGLAGMDVLNTLRLHAGSRQAIRRELRDHLDRARTLAGERRAQDGGARAGERPAGGGTSVGDTSGEVRGGSGGGDGGS